MSIMKKGPHTSVQKLSPDLYEGIPLGKIMYPFVILDKDKKIQKGGAIYDLNDPNIRKLFANGNLVDPSTNESISPDRIDSVRWSGNGITHSEGGTEIQLANLLRGIKWKQYGTDQPPTKYDNAQMEAWGQQNEQNFKALLELKKNEIKGISSLAMQPQPNNNIPTQFVAAPYVPAAQVHVQPIIMAPNNMSPDAQTEYLRMGVEMFKNISNEAENSAHQRRLTEMEAHTNFNIENFKKFQDERTTPTVTPSANDSIATKTSLLEASGIIRNAAVNQPQTGVMNGLYTSQQTVQTLQPQITQVQAQPTMGPRSQQIMYPQQQQIMPQQSQQIMYPQPQQIMHMQTHQPFYSHPSVMHQHQHFMQPQWPSNTHKTPYLMQNTQFPHQKAHSQQNYHTTPSFPLSYPGLHAPMPQTSFFNGNIVAQPQQWAHSPWPNQWNNVIPTRAEFENDSDDDDE